MQNITELQSWLEAASRQIVIIPHQRPDADALGAGLALCHWLSGQGHQPTLISPTEFPAFLNWMLGDQDVLIFPKAPKKAAARMKAAELFFCVDFSALHRMEPLDALVKKRPEVPIAMIDHHRGKEDFAHYELWDIQAAATAELVYDFLEMLEQSDQITPAMAALLYAGIMTDTGSFKHSNTTPKVHRMVASLMEKGADAGRVHRAIFDNNTENRTRFLGHALLERLVVLPEFHAAYFTIREEDLQRFSSQNGDTEGLVNYALALEGICLAGAFIEREGEIRISLRSVGDFSVADMAREHFNGGGHQNAAGGRFKATPLQQVTARFEGLLPAYQEALIETHQAENTTI